MVYVVRVLKGRALPLCTAPPAPSIIMLYGLAADVVSIIDSNLFLLSRL